MTKRPNWTEWMHKRAEQHRINRANRKILASQLASMDWEWLFRESPFTGRPKESFHGGDMQSPIQYK